MKKFNFCNSDIGIEEKCDLKYNFIKALLKSKNIFCKICKMNIFQGNFRTLNFVKILI